MMQAVLENQVVVDSMEDVFGLLYRVWTESGAFLGSFYKRLDGVWVAQLEDGEEKVCCGSEAEAKDRIVQLSR